VPSAKWSDRMFSGIFGSKISEFVNVFKEKVPETLATPDVKVMRFGA